MNDLARALQRPFPPDVVSWRVQGKPFQGGGKWWTRLVCYVTRSDVQNRLDEVFGPLFWGVTYVVDGKTVECTIHVHTPQGSVSKTDVGEQTDIEAVKGGYSDAFKRAATCWGIGRYLYSIKTPPVELLPGAAWDNALAIRVKSGDSWRHCLPPAGLLPDEDAQLTTWQDLAETARPEKVER